jgi:hypothetical protein
MSKKSTTPAKRNEVRAPELKKEFLEAYRASMFNISKAIKMVPGLNSRTTIYEWIKTDPSFANDFQDAREDLKDFAESQLIVLARGIAETDEKGKLLGWKERPDSAAVIFMNKALNKDRGYTERIEHEHGIKKESRIDLDRLTKKEREQWYKLLEKATVRDDDYINSADAEMDRDQEDERYSDADDAQIIDES